MANGTAGTSRFVDVTGTQVPVGGARAQGYWASVWKRLRRDPVSLACAAILLLIFLAAIFAPLIAPHDPYRTSVRFRLAPFGSPDRVLGGDELGRDMLSRLIYGGRISLLMGLLPVVMATLIGGSLGIIAGFIGGKTNMLIMRVMDVFYAFPSVLLAIAISGALGAGLRNGLIALTLVHIPPIARVSESVTTQVRSFDFVEAARASGAKAVTLIRVHVLGNVLGPILIYASTKISLSIIIAAGLSFLGLGVSPPEADWGLMLATLRQSIYVNPYVAALPGAMIFITSMCFNMLSDGLRSAMDVRL
ncbi:MAG: ABC transporter permease [Alphaproteobacteria bacterium]|nr:ABC transporter permease [Alphaproteobacteria bacterium]